MISIFSYFLGRRVDFHFSCHHRLLVLLFLGCTKSSADGTARPPPTPTAPATPPPAGVVLSKKPFLSRSMSSPLLPSSTFPPRPRFLPFLPPPAPATAGPSSPSPRSCSVGSKSRSRFFCFAAETSKDLAWRDKCDGVTAAAGCVSRL